MHRRTKPTANPAVNKPARTTTVTSSTAISSTAKSSAAKSSTAKSTTTTTLPTRTARVATNSTTTTAAQTPFLAHELHIAQLAVQRAALATKRFLVELNANKPPPPANNNTSSTHTAAISQFRHHPSSSTTNTTGSGAAAAAAAAGRLSLAKADNSPVTVADLAAQALLISAVHKAFPHDLIIGEEDAAELRRDTPLAKRVWALVSSDKSQLQDQKSEALLGRPKDLNEMLDLIDLGGGNKDTKGRRFWCLDPIDGTSAYMSGGQYAISLSLLQDGRELLGVLGCPNWAFEKAKVGVEEKKLDRTGMGLMLSAVKGEGATVRRIGTGGLCEATTVRRGGPGGKRVDLSKIHFVDSSNSPATLTGKVKELASAIGAEAGYTLSTQLYSSHMRYAAIVLGGWEFVQLRWPKPGKGPWSIWDHAGSQLIYTESGTGKVTDLSGKPINFTTGNKLSESWGLITADESIHRDILGLVNRMRAAEASAKV